MSINLTLFAQAAVFLAFIWFTVKVVWPPVLRAIETRQKNVAEGLAAAERGRLDLAAATKRSNEMLVETKQQAQEIITLAERRATQLIAEPKATAKTEGDRMIAGARAEIDQQFSRARETLREDVAALAVAGAEKILRREVDAKAHADLLSQIKQELR